MYLSSWAQLKRTENSSFHRAFFCAVEKSTIKSTILGAIGVPEPLWIQHNIYLFTFCHQGQTVAESQIVMLVDT